MKTWITTALRFVLTLAIIHSLGTVACAELDLNEEEQAYINNRGPIVFVSQSHYAPFEFIHADGNRDGMCIELARWIATELGFKARFVDSSFASAQQMIRSGDADVLTSFFYSEKRDRLFDFTEAVFQIPATIFVAAERPDIKGLSDLNGKTIAIQQGDYAEDYLHEKGIVFTLLPAENFSEATDMVIAGKADAIIGDEQIVLYHLYSNSLEKKLKKVGRPLYTGENAMAVMDGETILADILNKGIQLARERGVLKSINDKWLGVKLPQQNSFFYQYRWYISLILLSILILLVVIWLWNISLRREVRRRTRTLRESEHFLDMVIEHIPNMIFVKKATDLSYIKFNRAGEQLTGYNRNELYGKCDHDFFPPEQADSFTRKDRDVLAKGAPIDIPEEVIRTRHRGERTLHTQKIPILDETGTASYLLGISEDISDRLATEQARRISDERLRAAIDAIDEGFVIYDAEDRLVMCNQKYREIYDAITHLIKPGVPFSDHINAYGKLLFDQPSAQQKWVSKRLEEHRLEKNAELRTVSGRWIKLAERKTSDGSTVGIRVDITRMKQSEQDLIDTLKEKETLLKEVHHRVKNNMQVISSLLNLQQETIDAPELAEIFKEASRRIRAMALIHENLYQSESFCNLSVEDYLERLTSQLLQSMDNPRTAIVYDIRVDDIKVTIDAAVPFGLMVTEILTNAIKYAFPGRSSGCISIRLSSCVEGYCRLRIEDNGLGLPPGFVLDEATTLGMRLISDIAEKQLEGHCHVDGSKGVRWDITWPCEPRGRSDSGPHRPARNIPQPPTGTG